MGLLGQWVLAYQENNGRFSRCLVEDDLPRKFWELHDLHGHYALHSAGPGRYELIQEYCLSCKERQAIGPNIPPDLPHLVVAMMPMDLTYLLSLLSELLLSPCCRLLLFSDKESIPLSRQRLEASTMCTLYPSHHFIPTT